MKLFTWIQEINLAKVAYEERIAEANKRAFLEALTFVIVEVKVTLGSKVATLHSPRYMKTSNFTLKDQYCFFDDKFLTVVKPEDLQAIKKVPNGYILEMGCVKLYAFQEVK